MQLFRLDRVNTIAALSNCEGFNLPVVLSCFGSRRVLLRFEDPPNNSVRWKIIACAVERIVMKIVAALVLSLLAVSCTDPVAEKSLSTQEVAESYADEALFTQKVGEFYAKNGTLPPDVKASDDFARFNQALTEISAGPMSPTTATCSVIDQTGIPVCCTQTASTTCCCSFWSCGCHQKGGPFPL